MAPVAERELIVTTRTPHPHQRRFIESKAKRKVIRAGRRGGKTVGIAIAAVDAFLDKRRVLYAAPTQEQIDAFWYEVKKALAALIEAKVVVKNETRHTIEMPGTKTRIRAKTAWNADTLRGDYADLLILDEWQLMNEDAWGRVGSPMLLDNGGDAVFIYTPPSLHTRFVSKADDPQHAAKLYKAAKADTTGRWEAFHFPSMENPYLNRRALREIADDMTATAYRAEILAEDIDEAPGALWKRATIEAGRVRSAPQLRSVVVAIDPPTGSTRTSDEAGIIVAGCDNLDPPHFYVLEDLSFAEAKPDAWAHRAVEAFHRHGADRIVAERNAGGDMVAHTIRTQDPNVPVATVVATRGKAVRAEPIAALYEENLTTGRQGRVHHVGALPHLEEQMVTWEPGMDSPDRMDALVWALKWLSERTVVYGLR